MPMNPRLLRPRQTGFTPRSISGLALWLDAADSSTLYTTDAGPVTAVSSPLDIAGCALWLDGADATSMFDATTGGSQVAAGAAVARWQDKSGNGRHFVQSTASLRPILTASGRNGRSVVTFDATDDFMQSASTHTIPQPATWFFAYKTPAALAAAWSLTDATADRVHVYSGSGSNILMFAGATQFTVEATITADQWRIGTYSFAGASSTGRTNGAVSAAGAAGTNAADGTLMLGANAGGNAPLRSQIAEAILFSGSLSPADRARVEAYLAAKWGISGVHAQATATNDPVGAWLDKSGNGRHATQATAASRPDYSASAINSRSGLVFNGTTDSMPTTFRADSLTSFVGYAAVVQPASSMTTTTAVPAVFNSRGSQPNGLAINGGFTSPPRWIMNWSNTSSFASNAHAVVSSAPTIVIMTADATGVAARINGVRTTESRTMPPSSGETTSAVHTLGVDQGFANRFFSGAISELLAWPRTLTDAEMVRLQRYLAAKWGITLAPQVSNADAQDWVNRVYANGGTVSATTAAAVNTFCNAIDAAGIRDRFYRLNLFCGNSDASLAAVRTPLYRGPSLTGTQFGGTTDTNVNFVAGDYAETGGGGGLKGNGSTKYLNTGFPGNTLATGDRHLSVYENLRDTSNFRTLIGAQDDGGGTYYFSVSNFSPGTRVFASFQAQAVSADGQETGGHWIATDPANNSLVLYKNASNVASSSSTLRALPGSQPLFVFATNNSIFGSPGGFIASRLNAYSIGLGLSQTQATAYYNAMQTFQTALGRQV